MEISSSSRAIIIAVFSIYTIVIFAYSILSRKTMKSAKSENYLAQYSTGGRGMGTLMIAFMVAAGVAGAGVFMGVPGYIYKLGSVWLVCAFWSMSGNFMVLGQVGKKTGIVARRINAQSFVDMLMHRYNQNKAFGYLACFCLLFFLGAFAVSTITGGGRIFQVLTGLPYWIGLSIFTVLVIIAAVNGGVKGVATSILIQGIVMTICVLLLFLFGINSAGPIGEVVRNLATTQPEWFIPKWEPPMVISFAILWGFTTFTLPHVTMSALTYKDTKTLHKAIKVGVVVYSAWVVCLNLLVFPIKALFPVLESADLGIPTLAVSVLPAWAAGLVLAGVCAAVQSSVGGMIVSLTACFVKDFWITLVKPNTKPETVKKITLSATIIISLIIFAFAVNPPPLLAALITYSTGGLMCAFTHTMLLGYYWKGANEYGAIVAIVSGIALYLIINAGILPWSLGMNAAIMATALSTIIMVIVCKLTPKSPYGIIATWFGKDYPEA